jgi:hypothetical protein
LIKYLAYEGATESPIEVKNLGLDHTMMVDDVVYKYFFFEDMVAKPKFYE